MRSIAFILMIVTLLSCQNSNEAKKAFDLQGHRGCRGLYPENSIPGFIHAVDLGVTTLELDLGVTGDGELLVTHEPYMSATICMDSSGVEIADSVERSYNIYKMSYAEIQQFDCGSQVHPRFPEQRKMPVSKPLLSDVLSEVSKHIEAERMEPVNYNIEIKSSEKSDSIYHPSPAGFSDLVYNALNGKVDWSRVNIQSFDFRILQYFHETYPDVRLALLIENELPYQDNLDSLGFTPDIYSCYFKLLSRESITSLQQQGVAVIPWTVNETEDMQQLMDWGVDGLITDYPDRYNSIIE